MISKSASNSSLPLTNNPISENWAIILSIFLMFYLVFCWTFKLEELPGLHADEALLGLQAYPLSYSAIGKLTGMNYYTGMLQTEASKVFLKFFAETVFNLRISGILFNGTGIILIWLLLKRTLSFYHALIFLLFIGQSALYLCSPRVAWEVNTFTLFFSSLLLLAMTKLLSSEKMPRRWIFVVLATCMLGSYNHIIFSAIPIALFMGFFFKMLLNNSDVNIKYILLFGVCTLNVSLQLLFFKYLSLWYIPYAFFYPIAVVIILLVQTQLLSRIALSRMTRLNINVNPRVVLIALSMMFLCFVYFHGKAFFETLVGYKIYIYQYSWIGQIWLLILSTLIATILVFFLFAAVYREFSKNALSLATVLFVCYAFVLTIYTTRNSYRYYLELNLIFALYFVVVVSRSFQKKTQKLLICTLILSICVSFYIQVKILSGVHKDKAIDFKIGNSQFETSAHFLDKRPLIQFLRKNQVDSVIVPDANPYFLVWPIDFYRKISPWRAVKGRKAVIIYQSTDISKGGIIYLLAD